MIVNMLHRQYANMHKQMAGNTCNVICIYSSDVVLETAVLVSRPVFVGLGLGLDTAGLGLGIAGLGLE